MPKKNRYEKRKSKFLNLPTKTMNEKLVENEDDNFS